MPEMNSTSYEVRVDETHKRWRSVATRAFTAHAISTDSGSFTLTNTFSSADQDFSIWAIISDDVRPIILSEQKWAPFEPALRKILDALRLQPNWDGDGGHAPSKHTVTKAGHFLAEISDYATPPSVYVVGDGEIGFLWTGPNFHVEIGFFADGEISVLADSPNRVLKDVFTWRTLPKDQLKEILSHL